VLSCTDTLYIVNPRVKKKNFQKEKIKVAGAHKKEQKKLNFLISSFDGTHIITAKRGYMYFSPVLVVLL
jgi:hypothetical protein